MSDAGNDLKQAHEGLRSVLEPFGLDVGPELLALWLDREAHGHEPLPTAALRALVEWAEKRLTEPS